MNILHPSPLVETLKKFPLVYLATPYSQYLGGIELAFIDASKLAATIMRAGINIFCPIAHTHPLAIYGNINPLDHDLWMKVDYPFMEKSDSVLVGKLHGWNESTGVSHELDYFRLCDKSVFFIDPYTMELELDSYKLRRKKGPSNLHRSSGLLSVGSPRGG